MIPTMTPREPLHSMSSGQILVVSLMSMPTAYIVSKGMLFACPQYVSVLVPIPVLTLVSRLARISIVLTAESHCTYYRGLVVSRLTTCNIDLNNSEYSIMLYTYCDHTGIHRNSQNSPAMDAKITQESPEPPAGAAPLRPKT